MSGLLAGKGAVTVWIVGRDERAHKEMLEDIDSAPVGSKVMLDASPGRTNAQNRMMWKLLGCFAKQLPIGGQFRDDELWKCVLMKAFGKELEFVPGLDGSMVCIGYSSSRLRKHEMTPFIEFIKAEGALRGVKFYDGQDDDDIEAGFASARSDS